MTEMKFYHSLSQRLEDEITERAEKKINGAEKTIASIRKSGRRVADFDEVFLDDIRREARWEVRAEEYVRLGEERFQKLGLVKGARERDDEWEKRVLEEGERRYDSMMKNVLLEIKIETMTVEKSWN